MSYTLFGSIRSGSLAVELTLAEIGVDVTLRDVSLASDSQRDEAYAAINPQRKLPALVTPDDEILTESLAILLTLDERHPDAGLMPARGTPNRAQALRWLTFVATEIYPVVEIYDYPERFSVHASDATETRALARTKWRERWLVLEQAFSGEPYFLSTGFSLVDIYIAVVSRWADQDDWRPANIPRVERLTAAISHRPELSDVWHRHRNASPTT
jgi:GST-like protein